MKKHIFGFAIFSFIVGAAIVISSFLFSTVPEMKGFPVITEQTQQSRKTSCFMRDYRQHENNKVKIQQAVLDLKTKQLKTFISLPPGIEADKYRTVVLHFFVKDVGQTRYISSEEIWVKGSFDAENEALLTSLDWLDKSASYDNLYVVPEINSRLTNYSKNPPSFDVSKASPVLLSKGKGF